MTPKRIKKINIITGDQIGIIWKPQAFLPKKFTVLDSRLRLVVDDNSTSSTVTTVVNTTELIAMIAAESNGLIESIIYN
jgi:hypothetical protein